MMHRTSSRVLLIVAAFVLLLVPVAAIAAGGFTDVDDDSVFRNDIAWLADAGVTKGCNPPTNDKFCPESNVTREQMAAFMHRLAVNRVVDAETVQGMTAADLQGETGDPGPVGPPGADGVDGVDGFLPDGTPPVGTTERGNYTIRGDGPSATDSINWGFELPGRPTVHFLPWPTSSTADCPGTSTDPQAAEGHLCVYEQSSLYAENQLIFSGGTGGAPKADTFGALIIAYNTGTAEFNSFGTWAVTVGAP